MAGTAAVHSDSRCRSLTSVLAVGARLVDAFDLEQKSCLVNVAITRVYGGLVVMDTTFGPSGPK